jgi:uncharacterized protein (DUF2345 family)
VTVLEGHLVVPEGSGTFTATAGGRSWIGATSRSAKVQAVRALRKEFGKGLKVQWSFVLPVRVAADVEAYRSLERTSGRKERRVLVNERLVVARQLLDCRLSLVEAAQALGTHPGLLAQQLGVVRM